MSATGLAVILAAPRLGRLSDHIDSSKTLVVALFAAGIIFIPQAFVTSAWQLLILRFLLGIAQAGLLPSVQTLLKQHTPTHVTGRIFGYNQSFQFLGNMIGAVLGDKLQRMQVSNMFSSLHLHYYLLRVFGFIFIIRTKRYQRTDIWKLVN